MKPLKFFLFLFSFVLGEEEGRFFHQIVWGYTFPRDVIIRKMPVEVRSAPIHPADDYASKEDWAPIEEDRYLSYGSLFISYMPGIRLGRFYFSFGAEFVLGLNSNASRNYTNYPGTDKRGYGAALTQTSFSKHGPALPFFYFCPPKMSVSVNLIKKIGLGLGASISYLVISGTRGWDRHDDYEFDKEYRLAQYLPISFFVKASPEIGGSILFGVYYMEKSETTQMGREADIESNPTIFLGFEYDL